MSARHGVTQSATGKYGRALLFAALLFLASAAAADELIELQVFADGSADPPGDRIEFRYLNSSGAGELAIEVRAFEIVDEGGERHVQAVRAKADAHRDANGDFLLVEHLPLDQDARDASATIVVPYASLKLKLGRRRLGYLVSGSRDRQVKFGRATSTHVVRITDEPRRKMRLQVVRTVPAITTSKQFGAVIKGGVAERFEHECSQETRRSVSEVREVDVSIAGGFTPETRTYAGRDDDAVRRERDRIAGAIGRTAADVRKPQERTLFFATTRNIVNPADLTLQRFGREFVPGVRYGTCLVNVPLEAHHTRGKIETPGFWQAYDPERHFAVESVQPTDGPDAFYQLIGERLRGDSQLASRDVLLSVHGYNNTLEFALLRMAQVAFDIDFPGTPMLFSWPSQGSASAYGTDVAMAEKSEAALADVLQRLIAERRPARDGSRGRIHVIAHSLGNRLFLRALQQLQQSARSSNSPPPMPPLGHVVLAAPDVDETEFIDLAPTLLEASESVTLYTCQDDYALKASSTLPNRQVRAGEGVGTWPFLIHANRRSNVLENISADRANTSVLGHDYFASQSLLLMDIGNNLAHDMRPPARVAIQLLRERSFPQGATWYFP